MDPAPTPVSPLAACEPAPPVARPRGGLALLLWLVLAAGAVASGHAVPAVALAGLVSLGLLGPGLSVRDRGALVAFALSFAVMGVAAWHGDAPAVWALLPAQATALLAWLFARTLRPGRTSLVALAVAAMDGPARLEVPGLRAYARRLSFGWALACASLALLGLAAARAGGAAGMALHLAMPVGTVALFLIEYHWRRRRFADQPHPSFGRFLWQLAGCWNTVVRASFGERS